jgi:hypothetical protein
MLLLDPFSVAVRYRKFSFTADVQRANAALKTEIEDWRTRIADSKSGRGCRQAEEKTVKSSFKNSLISVNSVVEKNPSKLEEAFEILRNVVPLFVQNYSQYLYPGRFEIFANLSGNLNFRALRLYH